MRIDLDHHPARPKEPLCTEDGTSSEDREAAHHPDAATYGLDSSTVRPLFADYVQRAWEWTAARDSTGAA